MQRCCSNTLTYLPGSSTWLNFIFVKPAVSLHPLLLNKCFPSLISKAVSNKQFNTWKLWKHSYSVKQDPLNGTLPSSDLWPLTILQFQYHLIERQISIFLIQFLQTQEVPKLVLGNLQINVYPLCSKSFVEPLSFVLQDKDDIV